MQDVKRNDIGGRPRSVLVNLVLRPAGKDLLLAPVCDVAERLAVGQLRASGVVCGTEARAVATSIEELWAPAASARGHGRLVIGGTYSKISNNCILLQLTVLEHTRRAASRPP